MEDGTIITARKSGGENDDVQKSYEAGINPQHILFLSKLRHLKNKNNRAL